MSGALSALAAGAVAAAFCFGVAFGLWLRQVAQPTLDPAGSLAEAIEAYLGSSGSAADPDFAEELEAIQRHLLP